MWFNERKYIQELIIRMKANTSTADDVKFVENLYSELISVLTENFEYWINGINS
jgi:hypothetical protein